MTREEVKQCAEIMMEYANGKTVQVAVKSTPNDWKDITDDDSPVFNFAICNYRIKPEVKEPTYRPYKDCEEMIKDYMHRDVLADGQFTEDDVGTCDEQYNYYKEHNPLSYMPTIWIRRKATGTRYLITCFGTLDFSTSSNNYTMEEALVNFIYLDGSPCGKLEE